MLDRQRRLRIELANAHRPHEKSPGGLLDVASRKEALFREGGTLPTRKRTVHFPVNPQIYIPKKSPPSKGYVAREKQSNAMLDAGPSIAPQTNASLTPGLDGYDMPPKPAKLTASQVTKNARSKVFMKPTVIGGFSGKGRIKLPGGLFGGTTKQSKKYVPATRRLKIPEDTPGSPASVTDAAKTMLGVGGGGVRKPAFGAGGGGIRKIAPVILGVGGAGVMQKAASTTSVDNFRVASVEKFDAAEKVQQDNDEQMAETPMDMISTHKNKTWRDMKWKNIALVAFVTSAVGFGAYQVIPKSSMRQATQPVNRMSQLDY